MRKYFYSKNKENWSDKKSLFEIISLCKSGEITADTYIWHKSLCPVKTEIPEHCNHLYNSIKAGEFNFVLKYLLKVKANNPSKPKEERSKSSKFKPSSDMPHFTQGEDNQVRDFVFPIVTGTKNGDSYEFKSFLGTGFLIGINGFGVTARHVLLNFEGVLGALFVEAKTNLWIFLPITNFDSHPTEDVSIFKIENPNYVWRTPFRLSDAWEGSWRDYMLAGYPADVVFDNYVETAYGKRMVSNPDLVSIKGYIRRRLTRNLEIENVQGKEFFELSTVAGKGCSGSPVFYVQNRIWKVIGVYSAEKQLIKKGYDDELGYVSLDVSYAVRIDPIFEAI